MIRIEKKKNFSIISWAITRNFQNLGIGTNVLKKQQNIKGLIDVIFYKII